MNENYMVWDEGRVEEYIQRFGTPQKPEKKHGERMRFANVFVEGNSVLDIGSGIGHFYPYVKDKVYLGVDVSEAMLRKAKELNPDGSFEVGDVYDLGKFGIYDSVICLSLLIHLPDIEKAIQEMWKHVGKCLIFGFELGDGSVRRERYKDRYILYRRETQESIDKIVDSLGGKRDVYQIQVQGSTYYVKVSR